MNDNPNDSTQRDFRARLDAWCAARRWRLLLCILGLAVVLRIVVFCELRDGPVFTSHELPQTDMSFFDKWATYIVEKDFWTKDLPLHPIHHWHHLVGEVHFRNYPEALGSEYSDKAFDDLTVREKTIAVRNLWVKWYGGNRLHQAPLYPYFLAAVYGVTGGSSVATIFVIQMLLGVLAIGLMMGAVRRLFDDLTAVVTGVLMVLWAPLIHFETVLLRTSFIVFFGVALLYCTQRLIVPVRRPAWKWLLFGCLIGSATALKTTFFAIGTGLLLGVLFHARRAGLRCLPPIAWTALGVVACLVPFFVRNIVADAPLFSLTSVGAVTFVGGNLPSVDPWLGWYPFDSPEPIAEVMHASQGSMLSAVRATIGLHDSVLDFAGTWWRNFGLVWHWFEIPNNVSYYFHNLHSTVRHAMRGAVAVWWLVPFALIGVVAAWRVRGHRLWLFYVACSLAPMIVFYVLSRFRVPAMVGVMPFTVYGILALAGWILRRSGEGRSLGRAALAGLAAAALAAWMLRSAPVETVPSHQFTQAYERHYMPRLEAAKKQNDSARIVELLSNLVAAAPSYVIAAGSGTRPESVSQVRTAQFYARVFDMHAQYLAPTDPERARYYGDMASRIRSILPKPAEMPAGRKR